jgi:methionine-rich copper-binding protein CopC
MHNYRAAILASGIAALLFASPAFGHARILSSNPANNAKVAAPKTIRLTFSEKITPAFSGFDLTMGGTMKVALAISVSADGKTITGKPKGAMMTGPYQIHWHAAAVDDGHHTEGTLSFSIK